MRREGNLKKSINSGLPDRDNKNQNKKKSNVHINQKSMLYQEVS